MVGYEFNFGHLETTFVQHHKFEYPVQYVFFLCNASF